VVCVGSLLVRSKQKIMEGKIIEIKEIKGARVRMKGF